MAGFAKNVTTPIDIPQIQAPNFSQNTSVVQDVVGLAGFGLQINARQQAMKAEEARKVTLSQGLEIANSIQGLQGQISGPKLFREAQKRITAAGGGVIQQAELGAIVAQQFGFSSLGQATLSESEKLANNLEQELSRVGEFGNLALMQVAPNSTFSELDNGTRERVVELGLKMQVDAGKVASDKRQSLVALETGNLNQLGAFFKADKEQYNALGSVMVSLYGQLVNTASKQGLQLVAADLLQMKESVVFVAQNQKSNLQDMFSADRLLKIDSKDRASVQTLVDKRVKFYDDQIKFVNELEADEFKNFADTAKLLSDKHQIDLLRSVPELLKFKALYGPQAMNLLVTETIAKKPEYREALANATLKGFEATGITREDTFNIGLGIVAGIGEGKTIQDYDEGDANTAADIYWKTTKEFISNAGMIDNSTQEGVVSMAIAAVNVLEFAEERGAVDDKQRALQTTNSPEFKKLYDKSPPEIKSALGRKVVQYNRDTLENNIKRIKADEGGFDLDSTTTYNADTGKFEVDFTLQIDDEVAFRSGGGSGVLLKRKQLKDKVEGLNKQLEVVKIYSKDDPFLSSLTDKEQRDFLVRSAGLPRDTIKGRLTEFSSKQEEAQRAGISVADLKERTSIQETTSKAAGVFSDIERQVQQSNIPQERVNKALQSVQAILGGQDANPLDLSDLDDEELEQFIADEKARRASK